MFAAIFRIKKIWIKSKLYGAILLNLALPFLSTASPENLSLAFTGNASYELNNNNQIQFNNQNLCVVFILAN
jgi:hypothetical protein